MDSRFWIGWHFGALTLATIGKSVDGKKNLTKDSNAYYKLLRSNDLELGAESDLFCEVPCIRGEKPVRSRLQGRDDYGDISLVADQMAMAVDLLLGRKGNELTYSARMILNTLRRERINRAREALHGARSPSKRTPESRKTLGMEEGLPLPIKAVKASSTYPYQVLQSLPDGDPSACQCLLDALTKMTKGQVRGHNHKCLTELDEQDLTPLRELVQLTVFGRDHNSPLLSHSGRFNRPDCSFWHEMAFSFVNISKMRVARPEVACKWFSPGVTIPPNVLARADKVIK